MYSLALSRRLCESEWILVSQSLILLHPTSSISLCGICFYVFSFLPCLLAPVKSMRFFYGETGKKIKRFHYRTDFFFFTIHPFYTRCARWNDFGLHFGEIDSYAIKNNENVHTPARKKKQREEREERLPSCIRRVRSVGSWEHGWLFCFVFCCCCCRCWQLRQAKSKYVRSKRSSTTSEYCRQLELSPTTHFAHPKSAWIFIVRIFI